MSEELTIEQKRFRNRLKWSRWKIKRQAEQIVQLAAKLDEMRMILNRVLDELPTKRDWLDPDLERIARAALAQHHGTQREKQ